MPSTFTGTSFQIRWATLHLFIQDCTWVMELLSYSFFAFVMPNLSAVLFVSPI